MLKKVVFTTVILASLIGGIFALSAPVQAEDVDLSTIDTALDEKAWVEFFEEHDVLDEKAWVEFFAEYDDVLSVEATEHLMATPRAVVMISTPAQFADFLNGNLGNDGDTVILTANINMANHSPLLGRTYFDGVIIGLFGNTISNLTIEGPGLIHESENLSFLNLTFTNLQVNNSQDPDYLPTGGLVGTMPEASGYILFDSITIDAASSVIGRTATGGFVGTVSSSAYWDWSTGTWVGNTYEFHIINSTNQADVRSLEGHAGGFVADIWNALSVTLQNVVNEGTIVGYFEAGGIAASLQTMWWLGDERLSLFQVDNHGDVTSNYSMAAGIAAMGAARLSLEFVTNTGTIVGREDASGIGQISGGEVDMFDILNTGDVSGDMSAAGGVSSWLHGDTLLMVSVINEGVITTSADGWYGNSMVGGIAGYLEASTFTGIELENHGTIIAGRLREYGHEGAGGLIGYVGWAMNFSLTNALNTGSVTAYGEAGGLIGLLEGVHNGLVMSSLNTGAVSSHYENAGGIVGVIRWNTTVTIQDTINSGNVTAYNGAGGIAGAILGTDLVRMRRCTNSGAISSQNNLSGPFYGDTDGYSTISII
ncbi:MAG: hypothetical protein FWG67_07900 [Defluviitaleaceae bacterium]|nr:hypothetical protein [Defluviitaleaceae bacterium]